MCNTPQVSPVEFKSWSDCTKAGAVATITVTNNYIEKFNKEKLYVSYFCNEHKGNDA
jgi:hypothetical protein